MSGRHHVSERVSLPPWSESRALCRFEVSEW
jgi:hypothetical protein